MTAEQSGKSGEIPAALRLTAYYRHLVCPEERWVMREKFFPAPLQPIHK